MSLDAGLPGLVPQAPTASVAAADRGGTGIARYSAGNFLRAANELELEQRTPAQVLSDIGAAAAAHTHSASDITSGTLTVVRGGTGISSYTAGNYIRAASASSLEQRTPAQVLGDIGAAAASHTHAPGDIDGITGPAVVGRVPNTSGPASAISPAHSVTLDATGLRLVNDTASPGNNQYYGTNASGTRGWYDLSSGGSSTFIGLTDTPSSFPDLPFRVPVVNRNRNALIWGLRGGDVVIEYEDWTNPALQSSRVVAVTSGTGANAGNSISNASEIPNALRQNGWANMSTGTTSTGYAGYGIGVSNPAAWDYFRYSLVDWLYCEVVLFIPILPTTTENFRLEFGFIGSNFGTTHSILLQYGPAGTYNTWHLITTRSNTSTIIDTTVGMTANEPIRLAIFYDRVTSLADVRVGSQSATSTTNIPSDINSGGSAFVRIVKTAGTTSRTSFVDYMMFAAPRA